MNTEPQAHIYTFKMMDLGTPVQLGMRKIQAQADLWVVFD